MLDMNYLPTLGYNIFNYSEVLEVKDLILKINVSLFDTAGKFEFNYLTNIHYMFFLGFIFFLNEDPISVEYLIE